MPSYSGVWTLTAQYQAKGADNWPFAPPVLSGQVGLLASGYITASITISTTIDFLNFASYGTTASFGNLTVARQFPAGCSSSTRGVFGGGDPDTGGITPINVIDYVTILTAGTATDFGDLTVSRWSAGACSSSTRGLFAGGNIGGATSNVIDYVTIASAGNAIDFGDTTPNGYGWSGSSSTTRGVFGSVYNTVPTSSIVYVTIATTGNSTTFGNLSVARYQACSMSSSTRALFSGGSAAGSVTSNVIDYITIATTGNATDFGDLATTTFGCAGVSNAVIAVTCGGYNQQTSSMLSTMQVVTIASTGNSTSFGTLQTSRYGAGACSNAHGGL